MNRWHVYEAMKRQYRQTREIMSRKEIAAKFPGIPMEELREGMIEFEIARERTFSKEVHLQPKVKATS